MDPDDINSLTDALQICLRDYGFCIARAAVPRPAMKNRMLAQLRRKPCEHKWRDVYGDEINARNCRSYCLKCRKRSLVLMQTPPLAE